MFIYSLCWKQNSHCPFWLMSLIYCDVSIMQSLAPSTGAERLKPSFFRFRRPSSVSCVPVRSRVTFWWNGSQAGFARGLVPSSVYVNTTKQNNKPISWPRILAFTRMLFAGQQSDTGIIFHPSPSATQVMWCKSRVRYNNIISINWDVRWPNTRDKVAKSRITTTIRQTMDKVQKMLVPMIAFFPNAT